MASEQVSKRNKSSSELQVDSNNNQPAIPPMAGFTISQRVSPIPPPEELQTYEVIQPGMANRLLTMVEDRQRHRLEMERLAEERKEKERLADIDIFKRTQWFGLVILALLVGLCFLAACLKNTTGALSLGGILAGVGFLRIFFQRKNVLPTKTDDATQDKNKQQ
jgi:uncharacterized membrane protein